MNENSLMMLASTLLVMAAYAVYFRRSGRQPTGVQLLMSVPAILIVLTAMKLVDKVVC